MKKKLSSVPYSQEHLQDIYDVAQTRLQDMIDWDSMGESLSFRDVVYHQFDKIKNGVGSIDTMGAEYFLLKEFVTEEMYWDFDVILEDFLKHCLDRLPEYDKVAWYHNDELHQTLPDRFLMTKVMNLIYNGTKLGDEYCIELMKQLYMNYHKKEYKILKRFKKISASEIISIADEEYDTEDNPATYGRILGMCLLFGIELEDSCTVLYMMLDKDYKIDLESMEREPWSLELTNELLYESIDQVEEMMGKELTWKQQARRLKYLNDINQFTKSCMHFHGYPDFCIDDWLENYMGMKMQLARTLSMLKLNFPGREWSWEELQQFTYVYSMAAVLAVVCDYMEEDVGMLLCQEDFFRRSPDEKALFKPDKIKLSSKPEKEKETKARPAVPVKNEDLTEADYLQEIQELRQKLNAKERSLANLRELYQSEKQHASEYHNLMEVYQQEHEELVSLRNFAYHSTEEYEELGADALEAMKAEVAQKRIMLVGGHTNWLNKLKREFPDWTYVPAEISTVCDGKMLENLDKLYFFTDHLSHGTYGKYVALAREKGIPFGYISNINLEMIVRKVYEDLK